MSLLRWRGPLAWFVQICLTVLGAQGLHDGPGKWTMGGANDPLPWDGEVLIQRLCLGRPRVYSMLTAIAFSYLPSKDSLLSLSDDSDLVSDKARCR